MSSDFITHSRKASFYKQFTSHAEFTPSFGLPAAIVCSLHKMKMLGWFVCLIKGMCECLSVELGIHLEELSAFPEK